MTEIPDFTDSDKAEAWLQTQPHQVSIAVAARTALRVVPALEDLIPSDSDESTTDRLILACLRAILVSGARAVGAASATKDQTEQLSAAAEAATFAADITEALAADAGSWAADAASYAALAATFTDTTSSASIAATANSLAELSAETSSFPADAQTNDQFYADAAFGVDAFTTPLWPDGDAKDHFKAAWQDWKSELAHNPDWDFWIRWYDGMWSGDPLPWALQTEIALIPNEVWDKGLAAVAEAIREIELNWLVKTLPSAERAELDPSTGKVRFVPIALQNETLIGAILSQVDDALSDVLAQPTNGLLDSSRETVVLRRTIARYGNDPQRIEMDFVTVARGLTRGISSGELAPSEEIEGLLDAVTQGAVGIRANHPEVAANRQQLTEVAFKELSAPQRETLQVATEIVATALTPETAEEFTSDGLAIYGPPAPRSLGPQDRNPGIAAFDEQVRLFSRTGKLVLFFKRYPDVLAKIEKSNTMRTVKVVKDVSWALGVLAAIAYAVVVIV